MTTNRPTPQRGTVSELITKLLDRGYEDAARPTLNAVARSTNSGIVQQRLSELETEAQRLADLGERLTPDNPILRALLADLETTLNTDSRLVDGAADQVQQSGIDAAGNIQRQLAIPGMTNAQLRAIGIRWNVPDPEAVNRLVQYSQSSNWATLMNRYGPDVLAVVNNQAIRGIALGWSPLHVSREVRRITEGLPAHVANNQLRTLQLTSYRDGTAIHQTANRDICQEVVRIATRDERTCLSCIAQHGDVIWNSETDADSPVPRVSDHHAGRCTSVVRVKGRPPLPIVPGITWFASLPPERQAQQRSFVDSPGKFAAYSTGKVNLRDFIHPYTDPVFNEMVREASLTDALKNPSGLS
jgi:hypothetical protein